MILQSESMAQRLKTVYKLKELLLGRSDNQTWGQSLYISHVNYLSPNALCGW